MDEDIYFITGPRTVIPHSPVSLGHHFYHRLLEHGDKVAQVQEVGGKVVSHSFSDLLCKGKNVANFLRQEGLTKGDTVMIFCFNTLDYLPLMLGTLFMGGTVAPVNPMFGADDIRHFLEVIQPAMIILNSASQASILEAMSKSGKEVPWFSIDALEKIVSNQEKVAEFELGEVDPLSDVALVLCSSGTSGKPKGVEHTHSSWALLIEASLFYNEARYTSDVVALNMAGPNWVSFHVTALKCLHHGMTLVLLKGFTVDNFLYTIQTYKVNLVVLGPDQVVALAKCKNMDNYDLSSLNSVVVGGAAVPSGVFNTVKNRLGVAMSLVYGLTESLGMVLPDFTCQDKPGNVGRLTKNTDAKVVDIETGKLLGRNCEGELCFRSPYVMKGYRNNPEATAATIDEDGFLHTGDVGYFDDDDFLYIKDRIKDLIKYRRDHVPPVDIEEVLLSHPAVLEAAVVGVFHEEDWEHATGVVVLRPAHTATARELLDLVQEKLPQSKWLHGGLIFMDHLPKNSSGKILKRELRENMKKR